MRWQGTIQSWDDARGFGFVVPNGGGDRAFLHISAFDARTRRPGVGDQVSYQTQAEPGGRLRAVQARFAQATNAPGHQPRRPARFDPKPDGAGIWLAGIFLAGLGAAAAAGYVPWLLPLVYLGMSVVTFGAYAIDKRAAQLDRWRTPESTLHLLELAGGWPGALLAQQWLRHKSRKPSYRVAFRVMVALNLLALVLLLGADEPQQRMIQLLKALDRHW